MEHELDSHQARNELHGCTNVSHKKCHFAVVSTLRVTQRNNESREVQPYGHQERFCAALLPSTATLGSGSSAAVLAAPTSPSLCGVRSSLSSLREVMATTTETAAARTWRPRYTARTRVDSSARWRAWNYWMSQSIEFSKIIRQRLSFNHLDPK